MLEFGRFLANLLSPLPIIIVLFAAGLIMLLMKRYKGGVALTAVTFILTIFFSFPFFAKMLAEPVEEEYKPYPSLYSQARSRVNNSGRPLKWIVVLGGGIVNDEDLPLTSKLSGATLARVVEGIRLRNVFPSSKLLLSGGSTDGDVREADLMKKLAVSLGVDKSDLFLETKSKYTLQQAAETKKIVRGDNFILVTSAMHAARAEAVFREVGLKPIVLPSDYNVKESIDGSFAESILPSGKQLTLSSERFYEVWANIGELFLD